MGWVAILGSTLIAIMFVYNWLSKGNSPVLVAETDATQAKPSNAVEKDAGRGQNGHAVQGPIPKVQPPIIATNSDLEPTTLDATDQDQAGPKQPLKTPGVVLMPPPPPPSITLAPSIMNPPRSKSPPRLKPPSIGRAPVAAAPRPGGGTLRPPPSAAASLRVPQTKVLNNTHMAPSSLMPPPQKVSKQVTLEPGHSPLDWAALTSNPNNKLRGKDAPDHFIKVTPSMLRVQNGRKGRDAWTVYQGKVYNITPYEPFHPGGVGELRRGAGKDSAKLFMEVHPWVNWDGMLSECCVGILVGEDEGEKVKAENQLDEMD